MSRSVYLSALCPSWKHVFSIRLQNRGSFPILLPSCVTLTAKLTKISEDALPTDGSVEPGTFNYELGMYLRDSVISSRDYIRQHLGFLQDFDVNNAHYVVALLLHPRYTRLTLLVDYARINGIENIPHIKRNVMADLGVLIEWLQSLYNSLHGHAASQDSRDRKMAEAFDLFDVTSSNAANVESTMRKEFSLYQKDWLNYVRDRPVFKLNSEREDKFPHVAKLARCDFAIPGSQIDNERVFLQLVLYQKTVETALEYKMCILQCISTTTILMRW